MGHIIGFRVMRSAWMFEADKHDMKKRDNLKSIDCTGHSIRIVLV